jgi:hypothetical protein
MKKIFESFKETQLNEAINWVDRPSKIAKELLDMFLTAAPELEKEIEEVEGPTSLQSMISPPTVSNKGQSMGERDYKVIHIKFKKPIGKQDVTNLTIGIIKRTSGPDTGYLAIKPLKDGHYVNLSNGNNSIANEFYTETPAEVLRELINTEIVKLK